jgi:hypothetical protein
MIRKIFGGFTKEQKARAKEEDEKFQAALDRIERATENLKMLLPPDVIEERDRFLSGEKPKKKNGTCGGGKYHVPAKASH